MPQYQVGQTRSIHKMVRVNADDSDALIVKNLGNGRKIPLLWATTVTLASGTTEVVVASGVAFSGFKVSDAKISITPTYAAGVSPDTTLLGNVYLITDSTANSVTLTSTVTGTVDTDFNVFIFTGDDTNYVSTDTNMLWRSSGANRMG